MTLLGTIDTFDAAHFTERLSEHLRVPPATIALDVRAASVHVGVSITADGLPEGQRIETLLRAYNETALSAALGDGYAVEEVSRPWVWIMPTQASSGDAADVPGETRGALSGDASSSQAMVTTTSVLLSAALLAAGALAWRFRGHLSQRCRRRRGTVIAVDTKSAPAPPEEKEAPPVRVSVALSVTPARHARDARTRAGTPAGTSCAVRMSLSVHPERPTRFALSNSLNRLLEPPSATASHASEREGERHSWWVGEPESDREEYLQRIEMLHRSDQWIERRLSEAGALVAIEPDSGRTDKGDRLRALAVAEKVEEKEDAERRALKQAALARARDLARARSCGGAGAGGSSSCTAGAALVGGSRGGGSAAAEQSAPLSASTEGSMLLPARGAAPAAATLDPVTMALHMAAVTGTVPRTLPALSAGVDDAEAMARVRARVETARRKARARAAGDPELYSPIPSHEQVNASLPPAQPPAAMPPLPEGCGRSAPAVLPSSPPSAANSAALAPAPPRRWVRAPSGTWVKAPAAAPPSCAASGTGGACAGGGAGAPSGAQPAFTDLHALGLSSSSAAAAGSAVVAATPAALSGEARARKMNERLERARAHKKAEMRDTRQVQLRWLEKTTVYGMQDGAYEPPVVAPVAAAPPVTPPPPAAEAVAASHVVSHVMSHARAASRGLATPEAGATMASVPPAAPSFPPPRSPVTKAQGWLAKQLRLAALDSERASSQRNDDDDDDDDD